jgi:hypothetical protein
MDFVCGVALMVDSDSDRKLCTIFLVFWKSLGNETYQLGDSSEDSDI